MCRTCVRNAIRTRRFRSGSWAGRGADPGSDRVTSVAKSGQNSGRSQRRVLPRRPRRVQHDFTHEFTTTSSMTSPRSRLPQKVRIRPRNRHEFVTNSSPEVVRRRPRECGGIRFDFECGIELTEVFAIQTHSTTLIGNLIEFGQPANRSNTNQDQSSSGTKKSGRTSASGVPGTVA